MSGETLDAARSEGGSIMLLMGVIMSVPSFFSFPSRVTAFALLLCGAAAAPLYAQVDPGEQQVGGEVPGFLGVELWNLTAETAPLFGRTPAKGALVLQAVEGSPAAGAGLLPGDLIVGIDGVAIVEWADVVRRVGVLAAGTRVQLGVVREGAEQTIAVILGERPTASAQPSGIERLRANCTRGSIASCAIAGNRYALGDGVPQNPFLAVFLLTQACDGGFATGCVLFGDLYRDGRSVPQNYARAAALYQQACEKGGVGHAEGCYALGIAYEAGRGVPTDWGRMGDLFDKACEGGFAWACYQLADYIEFFHGESAESLALLQKACSGGVEEACAGIVQDDERSVVLYEQDCDGGHAPSCNKLGILFLQGRGVSQDEARAARLFQEACDSGEAMGCSNLGLAYLAGRGVVQDEARAAALFERACDEGHYAGCTELGLILDDPRKAMAMFVRGCGQGLGDERACSELLAGLRDLREMQAGEEAAAARGWLGAGVQDLTAEAAAALGRTPANGALVVQVVEDAPAAKAGLADGDLIIAVDGKEIGPARELVEAMGRLAPGAETRLTIIRDGVVQTVLVSIEQRPSTE